jgi:hypothetical protein
MEPSPASRLRIRSRRNLYVCPGGKELRKYHRAFAKPRDGLTKEGTMIYSSRRRSCDTRFVPNFYKPGYKLTVPRSSNRAKNAIKLMVAGPRLELGTYGL